METTIRPLHYALPLSIHEAVVVHADKYSRTRGGAFNLPVQTTVYIDVVFRIPAMGDDYSMNYEDNNHILYAGQEVALIVVKGLIVGYIDRKTDDYFFLLTDFAWFLRLGIDYRWIWAISIGSAVAGSLSASGPNGAATGLALFAAFWGFYFVQKLIINLTVRKSISAYLTKGDRA